MKSLPNIQKRILMTLIDDQLVFEKDLHKKLKADFPDLSINDLRQAIKELANDWRYVYAHKTSWGYKVELNSIGESEARRLTRAQKVLGNWLEFFFYHIFKISEIFFVRYDSGLGDCVGRLIKPTLQHKNKSCSSKIIVEII